MNAMMHPPLPMGKKLAQQNLQCESLIIATELIIDQFKKTICKDIAMSLYVHFTNVVET